MNQVTYLLYLLSTVASSPRPKLIKLLTNWHQSNSNFSLEKFNLQKFCAYLELNPQQTTKFLENFRKCNANGLAQLLQSTQTSTVNIFENNYPVLLRQIPDPPLILFLRGDINILKNNLGLAIVGSRRCSNNGQLAVEKIIKGLYGSPLSIISGLAYGIDSIAHHGALKHNLKTVAVLGSGTDDGSIYPKNNFRLAQQIIESGGLIISEYPPITPALKHQFVARNRIIAGLSLAVIIAEAHIKSGALITADFAIDYNRLVFALPGSILWPQSIGPNQLIQNGAILLQDSQDILSELGLQPVINFNHSSQQEGLSIEESNVLKYMQTESKHFEDLLTLTKFSIQQLQGLLTSLELKDLVKQVGPQIYQKL